MSEINDNFYRKGKRPDPEDAIGYKGTIPDKNDPVMLKEKARREFIAKVFEEHAKGNDQTPLIRKINKAEGADDNAVMRGLLGIREQTVKGASSLSAMFGNKESQRYYEGLRTAIDSRGEGWNAAHPDEWNVARGVGNMAPWMVGGYLAGATTAGSVGMRIAGTVGRNMIADAGTSLGLNLWRPSDQMAENVAFDVATGIVPTAVGQWGAEALAKSALRANARQVVAMYKQKGYIPDMTKDMESKLVDSMIATNYVKKPTESLAGKAEVEAIERARTKILEDISLQHAKKQIQTAEGWMTQPDMDKKIAENMWVSENKKLILNAKEWVPETNIGRDENGVWRFDTDAIYKKIDDDIDGYIVNEAKRSMYDPKDPRSNENFRNWFGNSQVVDETGAPQKMYHGTKRDFTVFKGDRFGASYFTPDPKFTEMFASRSQGSNVMETYLKAENIFDPDNPAHYKVLDEYLTKTLKQENPNMASIILDNKKAGFLDKINDQNNWMSMEDGAIQKFIKEHGYDGFYVKEEGVKNVAVYDPAQIKSVNNSGAFDPKDPNILNMKGADNIAAGLVAGVEQDDQGNITINPEKFLVGLGGYTAVKAMLKSNTVRTGAKIAGKAIKDEMIGYAARAVDDLEAKAMMGDPKARAITGIQPIISDPNTLAKVRKVEEEIMSGKTETLVFMDKKGNEIFRKGGNETEVVVTAREAEKVIGKSGRGLIYTHNHPNTTSFSGMDLSTAKELGIDEVRAVGLDESGSFLYEVSGLEKIPYYIDINREWEKMLLKYHPKYKGKFLNMIEGNYDKTFREESERFILKAHSHNAMKKLAEQFGFEYRRTRIRQYFNTPNQIRFVDDAQPVVAKMPMEAVPSSKMKYDRNLFYHQLHNNTNTRKVEFTNEVIKALSDGDGNSRILGLFGLKVKYSDDLIGSWEGVHNPMRTLDVPVRMNGDGSVNKMDAAMLNLVDALTGKASVQDGVGHFIAGQAKTMDEVSIVDFHMGKKVTKELFDEVKKITGIDPVDSVDGRSFQVINFEGMPTKDFLDRIAVLEKSLDPKDVVGHKMVDGNFFSLEKNEGWETTYDEALERIYNEIRELGGDEEKIRRGAQSIEADVQEVFRREAAKYGLDWDVNPARATDGFDKADISTVALRKGEEKLTGATKKNADLAWEHDFRRHNLDVPVFSPYDHSPKTKMTLAEALKNEVVYEYKESVKAGRESGKGWYVENFNKALDSVSREFPQVVSNQRENTIFTALVAITSDSNPVKTNMRVAIKAYEEYTKTGVIPHVKGAGKAMPKINENIDILNELMKMHPDDLRSWLGGDNDIRSITDMLAQKFGKNKPDLGYPLDYKDGVNSFVFGAKIGAFYQNLVGNTHYLTMDRWFERSFNRLRGNLRGVATQKSVVRFTNELKKAGVIPADTEYLKVPELRKYAKQYHDIYAKSGWKDKSEINKAAKGVYEGLTATADEPRGGADRVFQIETAKEALDLIRREKGMEDFTLADLQAVEWYYEKRFFKEMGTTAQLSDIGYGDIIDDVLRDLGKKAGDAPISTKDMLDSRIEFNVRQPNSFGYDTELNYIESTVVKEDRTFSSIEKAEDAFNAAIHKAGNGIYDVVDFVSGHRLSKAIQKIKDSDTTDALIGHKIYGKTEYMNSRKSMISTINSSNVDSEMLHEQLKYLSPEARIDINRYMSGDRSVPLDPSLRKFADTYIGVIDAKGKQMVDLGLLSEETFEKFKGQYLHRRYTKDLKDRWASYSKGKGIQKIYQRGKTWKGDLEELLSYEGKTGKFTDGMIEVKELGDGKYQFHRDWTREERAAMGEIEDIAFTLPDTLNRLDDMIASGKFLNEVADNGKYATLDAELGEARGWEMLRGKKYGMLDGHYVPKDVYNDITEFSKTFGGVEGFWTNLGRDYLTMWKMSHTVYNPTAHINNLFSNVTLQFGAGINPVTTVKNTFVGLKVQQDVKIAKRLMAKKIVGISRNEQIELNKILADNNVQLYLKAEKSGLFGRSRLNDTLMKFVDAGGLKANGATTFSKVNHKLSSIYGGEDDIMRYSMLKTLTDRGEQFDSAMTKINHTIPDYTNPMSYVATQLKNKGFVPFMSWTYHAMPIMLNQLKNKPSRAIAMAAFLSAYYYAWGINPFDNADIPTEGFAFDRIPIAKNGSEVMTLKVDKWIPHAELLNPIEYSRGLAMSGVWQGAVSTLNNYNPYFNAPITRQEGLTGARQMTEHFVQNTLPSPDIADQIYNLGRSQIVNKDKRRRNKVIVPRSTEQELIRLLGFNTLAYDKNAQKDRDNKDKMK